MAELVPSLPPHLQGQSSWLSRSTSARILGHPLVWSIVTALFILAGYFWLQFYAIPISEQITQPHADNELIGAKPGKNWNPDIYKPTTTIETMPITRPSDQIRSEDFRQLIKQENQILPLLSAARSHLEKQEYTSETHSSAWGRYQSILNIDPIHPLALSGQAQILQIIQNNAEQSIAEKQYDKAEHWLGQLDNISNQPDIQAGLRRDITNQINTDVAAEQAAQRESERTALLQAALSDAKEAMQVIPHELRAAYDLYHRALELDEGNSNAISGLGQIHLIRINAAKLAIAKKQYDQAQAQIDRLVETEAEPIQIIELKNILVAAKTNDDKQITQPQPQPQPIAPRAPRTWIGKSANAEDRQQQKLFQNEATTSLTNTTGQPETTAVVVKPLLKPALNISGDQAPKIIPNEVDKQNQLVNGINAYYDGHYNKAFEKLHPLAEDGIARAQFRLGIMYYQGRTVITNADLARQWIVRALPAILRASQKGDAWAQADLGTAYELGIGLDKDIVKAVSWYQKAADQNYAGGQTNLGVLYGTGVGVIYDRQKALFWLKRAAQQGDKVARDNLKLLNAR